MTPIERLRQYAWRYFQINIVDNGFCAWTCTHEYPRRTIEVAKRAMSMGFKVKYANKVLNVSY